MCDLNSLQTRGRRCEYRWRTFELHTSFHTWLRTFEERKFAQGRMVFANVFAVMLECVRVEKVRALSREQRGAGSKKETSSMLAVKRGAHTVKRTRIKTHASPHSCSIHLHTTSGKQISSCRKHCYSKFTQDGFRLWCVKTYVHACMRSCCERVRVKSCFCFLVDNFVCLLE